MPEANIKAELLMTPSATLATASLKKDKQSYGIYHLTR